MSESPEALAEWLAPQVPVHYLSDSSMVLAELSRRWCELHRHWHGEDHLRHMVFALSHECAGDKRDVLMLAALFHDAIYDPTGSENETNSARLLRFHARDPQCQVVRCAAELIESSQWVRQPETDLERRFFELDTCQFRDDCSLGERMRYEMAVFREYQWTAWPVYLKERLAFLRGWAERFPAHRRGVAECLDLLGGFKPRIAIYPGSFNPFHHGHLSILRQAESVFDKVIVAVGINRQKSGSTQALEERIRTLSWQLRYHQVCSYGGLLSDFLEQLGYPATVVRGVRDGTDLEAELRFSRFLNEYRPQTHVMWIGCKAELQHVSSSGIQELESFRAGAGRRYVPTPEEVYQLVDNVTPSTCL